MECADCFPWATLFGVIGTLVGTAVGSWLAHHFSAKQAEETRKYQDRTRFHNDRLQAYVELIGAHTEYIAAWSVHHREGREQVTTLTDNATGRFSAAYGRAKLIASEAVQKTVEDVFQWAYQVANAGLGEDEGNRVSAIEAAIAFEKAVKAELGILEWQEPTRELLNK